MFLLFALQVSSVRLRAQSHQHATRTHDDEDDGTHGTHAPTKRMMSLHVEPGAIGRIGMHMVHMHAPPVVQLVLPPEG